MTYERTVEFNNNYIKAQGTEEGTFVTQILRAIEHEIKYLDEALQINFIHRNPLPVQAIYNQLFVDLANSKPNFRRIINKHPVKIIFTYPSENGSWNSQPIWPIE